MKLRIALVGTFALATAMGALAQSSTDAGVGTWVLIITKSKFVPGPGPKSEMRTYQETADGLQMTSHVEAANGESHTEAVTYKVDGKSYPLSNNPSIDAIKVTRVNPREVRATELRENKVVGHLTRVVSKDGKVLTLTSDVTVPSGETEHEVRVYDRQGSAP